MNKLTAAKCVNKEGGIIAIIDGIEIYIDAGHELYEDAKLIAPQYVKPEKTIKENEVKSKLAVSKYINDEAIKRGYDSIVSACSYAGAVNDYKVEATLLLKWRGAVWKKFFQLLKNSETGIIDINQLPKIK